MMNVSALRTTPRSEMSSTVPSNRGWTGDRQRGADFPISRRERRLHSSLMAIDGYRLLHERHGGSLSRFFTYFGGPIAWTLEVAAVLLIIASHSGDFVSVLVAANLMMIVMMMGFKAGLGLWHASHPALSDDDALNRHPASRARFHHT